ncbi:MAG: VPLPA-CTERM sorting domain-containing protein [Halioglobus sp.]|nr:VPLPA-CTERM sorting domain-containing protein [Halioglobus sp.]
MRSIIPGLLFFVATWTHASTVVLPEIFVTETPSSEGGIYTVTINQPPQAQSAPWYLSAWGITNQEATSVYTGLSGWTGDLFSQGTWDSGVIFETYTPGEPIYRFTSGSAGVGDFDSIFGTGFSQAAVFWVDQYYADPGLVATSSNFNWVAGTGNSAAFAVISNSASGESLSCAIGVGSGTASNCSAITPSAVPLPAAVWLFGSALLGLVATARRRQAA